MAGEDTAVMDKPGEKAGEVAKPAGAGENKADDGSSGEGVESRFIQVSEDLEKSFTKVKDECSRRDLVSRRMQIRDAWEQRYFDRGNQFLVEGPYGQWGFTGESTTCNRSSGTEDVPDENNIYLAYRLQLTGVLTQNVPAVRFFPVNSKKKADLVAAAAGNHAKQIIQRQNNTISVQEDIVRFLYTDSLALIITDFDDRKEELELEVVAVLEAKLPMQQNYIEDCFYCIVSKEIDILAAKNKFKSKAGEIKGSTAPAAESEFERLARVACMQGMRPAAMTGDSLQWNVTEQRVWLKPDAYFAITNQKIREEAQASFPEGVLLYYCGKTFCGARPARMDDELTLIHAYSGDGMHRSSIGKPIVPIQKKLNNAVELMQQTLMNTIPVKWTHPTYVDLAALAQQKNLPGSYLKLAALPPSGDLSQAFYVEEQLEVPASLMSWITELRDNFPQLLTGAYPALTGAGDLGGNDTAQGIATERDAAMGRIGSIWRNMKEGYSSFMKNAVMCLRENMPDASLSASMPGRGGVMRTVRLDISDLRGEINCFPETEEAFPESWVQRRGVYMSLMQSPDPTIEQLANLPENLVLAKEIIGIEDFYIPQVVSRNKQLAEIDLMISAGQPEPNPALEQIDAQAAQLAQQAAANPAAAPQVAAEGQQLATQAQAIPPEVSSVAVDVDYDDHATEFATVVMFINSEEGQQLKDKSPEAFENIRLHGLEHKQAMAAQAAGAPPPGKPVSKSVTAGDLLKAGKDAEAAQLLAQAGIKATTPPPAAPMPVAA